LATWTRGTMGVYLSNAERRKPRVRLLSAIRNHETQPRRSRNCDRCELAHRSVDARDDHPQRGDA
jgi:hypothetical protein